MEFLSTNYVLSFSSPTDPEPMETLLGEQNLKIQFWNLEHILTIFFAHSCGLVINKYIVTWNVMILVLNDISRALFLWQIFESLTLAWNASPAELLFCTIGLLYSGYIADNYPELQGLTKTTILTRNSHTKEKEKKKGGKKPTTITPHVLLCTVLCRFRNSIHVLSMS